MARGNFRHIDDGLTAGQRWYRKNKKKVKEENVTRDKNYPDAALDRQLKKYGLDSVEFRSLTEEQNGVCKLCGQPETGKRERLSVDHCHETGRIRGLLCNSCNVGLGWLKHNPELLRKAAQYIEEHLNAH